MTNLQVSKQGIINEIRFQLTAAGIAMAAGLLSIDLFIPVATAIFVLRAASLARVISRPVIQAA